MSPDALRAALAAYHPKDFPALPGRKNHLPAGVLVPLLWSGRPEALAIARTLHLSRHAGEVAFPGGLPEPEDADLRETALREAREELGLEAAEVLGRLSSVPLYTSDFRLVPHVALVRGPVVPDPGEVAEVLHIDLLGLLEAPHLDAIPWEWQGQTHLSPVFPLGRHTMYGGTAYVLLELLQVLARALSHPLPPLTPGRYRWEDLLPR